MRVIQKTVINTTYQAIKANTMLPGVLIPFDCYVKRYNSYVVVIKAGTIMSEVLYEKLGGRQLFIANNDRANYDAYKVHRQDVAKISQVFIDISLASVDVKTKIERIYEAISSYMQTYFNDMKTHLEVTVLNEYVDAVLGIIFNAHYTFEDFSVTLHSIYSEAHHSVNVSMFSALFSKENGFEYEDVRKFTLASLLHDLGKRYISKKLLDKNSALDDDEILIMQKHPKYSVKAAKEMGITDPSILDAIEHHHEKLDGSGYPHGLMLQKISKGAQILAICDTFDALTTKRTFREKYSSYAALQMMKETMEKQLNGQYIKRFIKMFV